MPRRLDDPARVLAEIQAALEAGDLSAAQRKRLADRARRARLRIDPDRAAAERAASRERAALSAARRAALSARAEAEARLAALARRRGGSPVDRVERERDRIGLLRILSELAPADGPKLARRIRDAEKREARALDDVFGGDGIGGQGDLFNRGAEPPPEPEPPQPTIADLPRRMDRNARSSSRVRRLDNPIDLSRLSWQEFVDYMVEASSTPGLRGLDLDWQMTVRNPSGREVRFAPSSFLHNATPRLGSWVAELERRISNVLGPDVSSWSFSVVAVDILRYAWDEFEIDRAAMRDDPGLMVDEIADLPRPWETVPLWPAAPGDT